MEDGGECLETAEDLEFEYSNKICHGRVKAQMRSLLSGLLSLHLERITHRDIKFDNIVQSAFCKYIYILLLFNIVLAKHCDFGLS
jgi:serine/threonine protein kinase